MLLVAQTLALRKKFCLFLFLFCFLVLFIFYCYKVEFELKFRSSSKRWDKLVEGNSIENISPMQIISFTEMGSKIRFKFLQWISNYNELTNGIFSYLCDFVVKSISLLGLQDTKLIFVWWQVIYALYKR